MLFRRISQLTISLSNGMQLSWSAFDACKFFKKFNLLQDHSHKVGSPKYKRASNRLFHTLQKDCGERSQL